MHFLAHNEPIIKENQLFLHRLKYMVMDISKAILQFLHYHPLSSRDEIAKGTAFEGNSMKHTNKRDVPI